MNIGIKNRWSGAVIFAHDCEGNTIKKAVLAAVKAGSDLRGSDLRDSDLRGSDLRGSDLSGIDLSGSDLRCSDLRDSNLRDSNLRGSDLRGSDLTPIRDDIWVVLSSAPNEVPALIAALKDGRVDGSTYEGDCACLVGSIANVRHERINSLRALKPDSGRPAERFFLGISKGDKPETNQASALAVEWCEDWLNRMQSAFGTYSKKECS